VTLKPKVQNECGDASFYCGFHLLHANESDTTHTHQVSKASLEYYPTRR